MLNVDQFTTPSPACPNAMASNHDTVSVNPVRSNEQATRMYSILDVCGSVQNRVTKIVVTRCFLFESRDQCAIVTKLE
jgi:hypothetical protein